MTVGFKGSFKIWVNLAVIGVNEMLYQLS